MALSKASTQADQANSTRVATQDMQQSILAGDMGLQNLPSEMMQNL
jgi:hypothetical protein